MPDESPRVKHRKRKMEDNLSPSPTSAKMSSSSGNNLIAAAPSASKYFVFLLALAAGIGGFLFGYDTGLAQHSVGRVGHDALNLGHS